MTYLGAPRLHFYGQFQATVSTVNNTAGNFSNAATSRDPGWNPGGDADWRLLGCKVTSAILADGSPAAADDPVLECLVADSDRRVPGKLVDLDPEQQMCSMIFGLEVRVCDPEGRTLVIGRFEPAAFTELWARAEDTAGGDDPPLGAFYQSVVTDLQWSDGAEASPMLSALRAAATDGMLSMKFNVDGYDWTVGSPTFGRGRIAGTIGVAFSHEPHHFVAGRHFVPSGNRTALNNCVAVVDEQLGKVVLDLGNALPTRTIGGAIANIGTLTLARGGSELGEIAYLRAGWYEQTAGVVALPDDRQLSDAELAAIGGGRLSIEVSAGSGPIGGIDEVPGGVYARADQFVFRLDPGDTAPVRVFATRFGKPHAGAQVRSRLDPSRLQAGPGDPPVATPANALSFDADVVAGPDGVAEVPIAASDPGEPRGFIEGQVYGVRPALTETLGPGSTYPRTPWNVVSLLVHGTLHADDPPTWEGSLQPVFQQYSNLYPVMGRFLDLSSYESVCENRQLLLLAFGLPIDDPNSMPVTRDLSASARAAILRWLTDVGPDGKPLRGEAPSREVRPPPAGPVLAAEPGQPQGKAAAARRMIGEPDEGEGAG